MRRVVVVLSALLLLGCGESEPDETPAAAAAPTSETAASDESVADEPVAEESEATESDAPPEVAQPYEPGADAQRQIDIAVRASASDGKRVLLMFGANWCEWCRRLEYVFQSDTDVRTALDQGWHLVHVDVGDRGSDTNRTVAERYGNPIPNGLPCLVVLDDQGGVAHVQETGSLEEGDRHVPARVLAFLNEWRDGEPG